MTNIIAGWEMILLQLFNGHLKQHKLPEFLIGHGGSDSQDRKSRSRLVKVKYSGDPTYKFSTIKHGYEIFHIANNVPDVKKFYKYICDYEEDELKFVNLPGLRIAGKDPIAMFEARARRKAAAAKEKKSPYSTRANKRKADESISSADDEEY